MARAARRCRRWSSRCRSTRRSSTWPPAPHDLDLSTGGLAAIAAELKTGRRRGDRRTHRVGRDRAPRSWSPRSPASSTSPTARSSSRPAPSATCCAPMQVTVIPGVGPATAERLRQDRRPHRRASCAAISAGGAGPGARPGPRHEPVRAGARRRRPGRGGRSRDQVGVGRGHVRDRPRRPGAARRDRRPARPQRLRTAAQGASCRAAP